jgi:ribosomal protein L29
MASLKEKNEKDLLKELSEKREGLRMFRFGVSGSKVRNIKEGKGLKKDIARILTELTSRKNTK